jgi:hypothetical protein
LCNFYEKPSTRDGLRSDCKKCVIRRVCTYYSVNKEEITEYHRKYRLTNKDKIVEYFNGFASYEIYAPQLGFAETVTMGSVGELLVPCTYCGKNHSPTIQAALNRIMSLNGKARGERRFYCSDACKQACPSYNQERYWKKQKPATSREVSAYFRQLVLKRDNWICQRCGAGVEAELHVHHIEGAVQQPGMANDLENGITLCKECHKYAHSQDGCRYHELRCPEKVT